MSQYVNTASPYTAYPRHVEGRSHMSAMVNTTEKSAMKLRHATQETAPVVPGRREFFTYRDLGVTDASNGEMRAQVMSAITGMTAPTGWHYHVCQGQFVYALQVSALGHVSGKHVFFATNLRL